MGFLKNVVYLISKILLKTFHKKKYYESSPSKAIVPYMNKNKIQVYDDKFEEWLVANQDELKEGFRKAIEKISNENLKVESLEERKDKK